MAISRSILRVSSIYFTLMYILTSILALPELINFDIPQQSYRFENGGMVIKAFTARTK